MSLFSPGPENESSKSICTGKFARSVVLSTDVLTIFEYTVTVLGADTCCELMTCAAALVSCA